MDTKIVLDELMSVPTNSGGCPVELDLRPGSSGYPVPPEMIVEVETTFSVNTQEDNLVMAALPVWDNRIDRAIEFGKFFASPHSTPNPRSKSPYKARPKKSR